MDVRVFANSFVQRTDITLSGSTTSNPSTTSNTTLTTSTTVGSTSTTTPIPCNLFVQYYWKSSKSFFLVLDGNSTFLIADINASAILDEVTFFSNPIVSVSMLIKLDYNWIQSNIFLSTGSHPKWYKWYK